MNTRKIAFRKNFWLTHESRCEVCDVTDNYRSGRPAPGVKMDKAHLVAKTELVQFGRVGMDFNFDPSNFAVLCQKCHAALDTWLGVMGWSRHRYERSRFIKYYDRFLPILRRRHRLTQALISMTSEDV